jgi:hypothetical protein
MRSHRRFVVSGIVAAAAVSVTGAVIASGASADTGSPVVGHSYVDGNTTGTNTVVVLDRHADGALTPAAGSPFPIGGAGTDAGLGSQGAI